MTSSDPRDRSKPKNIPSPNDATRGYSRFIPREELNGFAAWQPGDLSGGPAPQANVHRASEEAPKVDVAAQLAAQLEALFADPLRCRRLGASARQVVARNRGSLERLLALIESLLAARPRRGAGP